MRIAVTGATGFIGRNLLRSLESSGHECIVVTRDPARAKRDLPGAAGVLAWKLPSTPLDPSDLERVDGVVHMAGAPVAQRWTANAKREIEESRVLYTRDLVEAIGKTTRKPAVLVSFSAIGYYGARDDTRLDETAAPGADFLATVCRKWETEAAGAARFGVRVVTPRIGVVIGKGGGALRQMLFPFRLGLGGPIGNGRQWMSWIHLSDVSGIAIESLTNERLRGPVNATAPEPVRNREFSATLGKVLHRPAVLPIPVLGLRLMFGGFAEILATGQRVVPQGPLDAGYSFRFPDLEEALAEAVS